MEDIEKESFANNFEEITNLKMTVLGEAAVGAIEPAPRVKSGEIREKNVQELAGRLNSGEFHHQLESEQLLPTKCVDGRPRTDGQQELGPNSAGGSFSLVVADMLTDQRLRNYGGETAENSAQYSHGVFQYLKDKGYDRDLGDHSDDHAAGEKSGCGAVDNMHSIISYMADHEETIRAIATTLGVEVSEDSHDLVMSQADDLDKQTGLQFVPGSEAMNVLRQDAGNTGVEELTGPHHETLLSVNAQPGTTLDRAAVREQFGDAYQAFNVDVWALKEAANVMAEGDQEKAEQKFTAMLYYNISTACVLGGKSLQVVTVQ